MSQSKANHQHELRVPLRGVIYLDGDWWVSHCLELDIVGQGKSPAEAYRNSLELCISQIEDAIASSNLESIFRPAPPEVWAMYCRARGNTKTSQHPAVPLDSVEFRELCAAV